MKTLSLVAIIFVLGIGQANAQSSGEITPNGVTFPRYTDANRPAGPLTIGTTIFNTSQATHQYWNGSSWTNVSTPGSGGGPWSAVGSNIYNNTGSRVGINTTNPNATFEVHGSSFAVNQPYTITSNPPTNTYTMPYNGTIPTITDQAGYILDPGGNNNFVANTNYSGYVGIELPPTSNKIGFKLTFESLDLGTASYQHAIIISTSSDVTNKSAYRLEIYKNDEIAKLINNPLIFSAKDAITGGYYLTLYIHFVIKGGVAAGTGFKILFQQVSLVTNPTKSYVEIIDNGIAYNDYTRSLAVGSSRAKGMYSSAFGRSEAIGFNSFAGGNTSAIGDYSTSLGGYARATGDYSTAFGYFANTNYKTGSFSITGAGLGVYNNATNDKDYQMKMHFDEFRFLTGAANDVTIIDGKITTSNTLWVYGSVNNALANYGYLVNNPSALTGFVSNATIPLSIYAVGRMVCPEFNAFSDARHKKLRFRTNGSTDLALLNQLNVSNYTFIDTVAKGSKMQLGFIAQEVEKIVPEAVNKIQDYIPSIYDMAKSIVYDTSAHTLTVSTNKPHDFQAKDEIKLISLDKEHKVKVASIIDAHTFVVANWEKPVDKLFVFGKRVDDFRTVDYDRLFTLGISSIQELSRKVEQLEKENMLLKAYKDEFSQMKNEVAELKAMMSGTSLSDKGIDK